MMRWRYKNDGVKIKGGDVIYKITIALERMPIYGHGK